MTLPLQDFGTLVKTQAAAFSSSSQQIFDMTVGSVLRALFEANASVALWVQWLIVQVLSTTRASTSTGTDLDTWVEDFGLSRFAAIAASGFVTFSRITSGAPAVVLPGVLVRTGLGANDQTFMVTVDTSSPSWTGTGYLLSPGGTQLTCPVVAQQVGTSGNVVAGSLTTLSSAIPGIDAVTNSSPMSGGMDAETDIALRARFSGFLDSRSRATSQAVTFAVAAVRQGVSSTVADRVDASGASRPGHFTVTVDDGTGTPDDQFLATVATAVEGVRPVGSTFSVRPPLIIPLSVQIQVTGPTSAQAASQAAIIGYVASLPIGGVLAVTRLYQVAYASDTAITNVSGALINGKAEDFAPPIYGLLRPFLVTVTS